MRVIPFEDPKREERITSFKTDPGGREKKVIKREEVKKKGLTKAVKGYKP